MHSSDQIPAGFGRMLGIVSFGGPFDVDYARAQASAAAGQQGSDAVAVPGFAIAHAGGRIHRQADLLCAFEGRLANRASLARRLGSCPFADPAQIAAAAYEQLGERAIAELDGEFVVAVWDARKGSGFIARDPLGARTIFVRAGAEGMLFASDLRWLLRMLPREPDIDPDALVEWMLVGGAANGRTLWQGIRRLAPGTVLRIDRRGWTEQPYWRPSYSPPLGISRDEAGDVLLGALTSAMRRQVDGAETVGVMLSGGLDSTIVAAEARDGLEERGKTPVGYSMMFPSHPAADESSLIREIRCHLGLPGVEMRIGGGSLLQGGLDFLRTWEVPSPTPNVGLTAALHRRAMQDGIEIMLDGEGGDELFAADPLLPASLLRSARAAAAWRLCGQAGAAGGSAPGPGRHLRAFRVLAIHGATPYPLQRWRRRLRRGADVVPPWLDRRWAGRFAAAFDPWSWKQSSGPLWWAHLSGTLTRAREDLWAFDYLRQIDAMSGIQRRHPLLDRELVETILRLPPEYAFEQGLDRGLARYSMKHRLPRSVLQRRGKADFAPFHRDSLLGTDLQVARRILNDPHAELRRFVNPLALDDLVRAAVHRREPRGFAIQAWRLVMAECWLQSRKSPAWIDDLLPSLASRPVDGEFARHPRQGACERAA